jgi:hypothetical protein
VRSLALLATGVWLGLLVASWMIASITFGTAAALLGPGARPEITERLAGVSEAERRPVLRHMASEINRAMFGRWVVVQLLLGVVTLVAAVRSGATWPAAAAFAIVLVQAGLQGPILELGRTVDFLPRPLPPDLHARFGKLHGAYVLLDFAKGGALGWLAWMLARAPR